MKLEIIKNNKAYDITNVIQFPVTYSGSSKEFASKLSFSTAYHSVNGFPEIPLTTLKDGIFGVLLTSENKVLFQGITKSIKSDERIKTIECSDPSFYVIKNEIETIQFAKITVEEALKKLFEKIGMTIKINAESNVKVDKIFSEKTVSAIIIDLLDAIKKEKNKDYMVRFENDSFIFDKSKKQKYLDGEYEAQEFFINVEGVTYNVLDFMSGVSYSEDIENLKNSVKVVYGDEKKIEVIDSAKDDDSIKKFGLLQAVVKQDKEEQKGTKENKKTETKKNEKKKGKKDGKK